MESTKSQLVLRSMDMDGRSLGTERSSTFLGGRSQAESSSTIRNVLGDGDRFAALLERRATRDVAQVALGVSDRVREGRTDAASQTYNSREAQAKTWKPREERTVARDEVRSEAGPQGGGSDARQANATSSRKADRSGTEGNAAAGSSSRTGLSGERGSPLAGPPEVDLEADPNDVQGQAAPHSIPLASTGPMGSSATLGGGNSVAAVPAMTPSIVNALPAGAQAGAVKAPPVQPAQSISRAEATKAARRPQGVAAPRQGLPAEQARAILDQVRVQILDGKREARIQLRPIELGRLDLLIRVDGNAVTAKVAAESPETLALLEAHAPELRAWLARDGSESVDLEFSLIDPGTSEFAHGEDTSRSGLDDGKGSSRSPRSSGSGPHGAPPSRSATDLDALLPSLTRRVAEGGVDIKA